MGLSEADAEAMDQQYSDGYQEGYDDGKRVGQEVAKDEWALVVKNAYTERTRLLAYIATLHDSHVGFNDEDEMDWPVLTIETPMGQMTWHIAPEDGHLLSLVRHTDPQDRGWDGHTTQEKYERLERLILVNTHVVRED